MSGAILVLLCLRKTSHENLQQRLVLPSGRKRSFTSSKREGQLPVREGQSRHLQRVNPRKRTKNKASSATAGTINFVARDLRSKIASLCSYVASK